MILASERVSEKDEKAFFFTVIVLRVVLLVAFQLHEFLAFYIAFETVLLPTFFLVMRWGYQPERLQAATYLVVYTVRARLPLLLRVFCLRNANYHASFLSSAWVVPSELGPLVWWFMTMGAFLVKTPLFSVHLWLPKAHVEAPVAGSMVLAGVLLKLGGYGMFRVMQHVQCAHRVVGPLVSVVAMHGAVVAGLVCLRQRDLKAIVAYRSVTHMGLVIAGILSNTFWG